MLCNNNSNESVSSTCMNDWITYVFRMWIFKNIFTWHHTCYLTKGRQCYSVPECSAMTDKHIITHSHLYWSTKRKISEWGKPASCWSLNGVNNGCWKRYSHTIAYINGRTKLAGAIIWNKSVKFYSNLESTLSKCIKFHFHTGCWLWQYRYYANLKYI